MTRVNRTKSLLRPCAIVLSLLTAACTVQPSDTSSTTASTDLRNALELYRSNDLYNAETALKTVYTNDEHSSADQRRALAAAILIGIHRNSKASLEEAGKLLERYSLLNSGPIEPEYYLLRESLTAALTAKLDARSQHEALLVVRGKLDSAQNERRQLEQTLKKLRELSLE